MSEKINNAVESYENNRYLYKELAKKVKNIIEEVLKSKDINFNTIDCRAKAINSYKEKIKKKDYQNPITDVKDYSGIRVITYINSEVIKVCDIIEKIFDIIEKEDKAKKLDDNYFGYKSIHYIAKLPNERIKLLEYKKFEGLSFEIQVRTLLQHAWAEIEHDRNYKFQGVLPEHKNIQRRFALVSGMLEMADKEFDTIAQDINEYADTVHNDAQKGNLDIELNTTSIREFLTSKFEKEIKSGLDKKLDTQIVEELKNYGINTLKDLNKIIPNKFNKELKNELKSTTFIGILRTFMMLNDIEKYFNVSWNENWQGIDEKGYKTLKSYNVPIDNYVDGYKLDFVN